MGKNPSVSVVIPSYNRFDYLIKAIDSVEQQTFKNFEIIIVNDGSDDSRYYSHTFDKNIKIVNLEENQKTIHGFGPGSIRNFGIDMAEGEYVSFLDDDDYWLPFKLEKQIERLKDSNSKMSNSDALIGKGSYELDQPYKSFLYEYYYKKNKELMFGKSFKFYFSKFRYPDIWDFKTIRRSNPIITSSVIIETELLKYIGGFRNLPYAADLDCWKAALQFTTSEFIKEPLVYYDNSHADGRNYIK
tara:strand:+ start:648 stop:1379 length:732 start_codon:yes stop_codon:yes gene_type:complete